MLKMQAILDGKLNGMNFEEFKNSGQGLSFGGFCFTLNINGEDVDVNFDWDCFVANVQEDGTLLLEEGQSTLFGGNSELDDIYDEEYEEQGFSRADLTAQTLANTSEIREFTIDYDTDEEKNSGDYLHIVELKFSDGVSEYKVPGDILDKYNEMEPYENIRAYGDLGTYDACDGEYEVQQAEDESYEDMLEELPF